MENTERQPIVGKKQIDEAYARLQKYKMGKKALETRIVNAEEWWKNNHWQRFGSESRNRNDPTPESAWLFNSLANKHADFPGQFPLSGNLATGRIRRGNSKDPV